MLFLNFLPLLLAFPALGLRDNDDNEFRRDNPKSSSFALLTDLLQSNPLFQVFKNTIGRPILSCLESDAEALPALIHYLADNPSEIPSIISQVPADALEEIENVGKEITSIPEELWAAITSFPTEAENIVTQLIAGHVPTQLESLGDEIKSDAEAFASNAKSFFEGLFGMGGKSSTTAPPPAPACLTGALTTSSTVVVTRTAAPSSSATHIAAITSSLSLTLPSLTSPTPLDPRPFTTSTQRSLSTTQELGSQQSSVWNETNNDAVGAGMLPLRVRGF